MTVVRASVHAFDLRPTDLVALAEAVDRARFDTLWLGEHVVAPAAVASVHPGRSAQAAAHSPVLGAGAHLSDLWVDVGAVAAVTDRVRIATGMCIVPLRHPLVTAQAAATAWRLSKGRFALGVGVGWLAEEFEALGIEFEARGARLDESLVILRAAWRGGSFRHAGPHFQLDELTISEDALDIPIVVGGNSQAALRRLIGADGWLSSGTPTFDQACALRDQIAAVRTIEDGFRCSFRVEGTDRDTVARYVEHGFTDLVFHVDQHVAARAGGWRPWLEAVVDAMAPFDAELSNRAGSARTRRT